MVVRHGLLSVPSLVRIKPGALLRLPVYLGRMDARRIAVFLSEGFVEGLADPGLAALEADGVEVVLREVVRDASFEQAQQLFGRLGRRLDAVVGIGGGKALDVAKYVAFLGRYRYVAVPTSLSNDGFCSPQSSLTMGGRRRSLPAALPVAVVVDTEVCGAAPEALWCSGVGDLCSKFTAVADWKRSFHATGEPVDDLAALLSDATVFQLIGHSKRDPEGVRLLATALMMNGIAMEICGSSRPASGSEHLVSHALDATAARPRLHGLQVGLASYLVAHLQGNGDEARIARLFDASGFWRAVEEDPMVRSEWDRAFELAPTMKEDFHTVLSEADHSAHLSRMIREDPRLARSFVD